MTKPRYNQKINLTIKNLGLHGEGIGYWHGYTVFVDDALPGEVIEGRVTQCEKRFGRARVANLVTPSPDRAQPPCPLFGKCGGCQLMHLHYDQQLVFKRQRIVNAFEKYETLKDFTIAASLPSPSPLKYRNKIQLPVTYGEKGMLIGLYARNSHEIIEIGDCLVHCELGESIFQKIRPLLQASGMTELRFLLIKTAVNTAQALVIFVVHHIPPQAEKLAQAIMQAIPEVKGVILNHNPSQDNVVLGDTFICLEGQSVIQERLNDLYFNISSASFFQVNTPQAEQLYRYAIEKAELKTEDIVVDAYCGVGTLSLHIAQKVKHVIGIECIAEAIVDAQANAALNKLTNTEFICDSTESAITRFTELDAAFINPPRKGCEPIVLDALINAHPRKIVYISCDPVSLARDLHHLVKGGYQIEHVQPFDMFPQTSHIETVVHLKRD